jgi:hypothetical protein
MLIELQVISLNPPTSKLKQPPPARALFCRK